MKFKFVKSFSFFQLFQICAFVCVYVSDDSSYPFSSLMVWDPVTQTASQLLGFLPLMWACRGSEHTCTRAPTQPHSRFAEKCLGSYNLLRLLFIKISSSSSSCSSGDRSTSTRAVTTIISPAHTVRISLRSSAAGSHGHSPQLVCVTSYTNFAALGARVTT